MKTNTRTLFGIGLTLLLIVGLAKFFWVGGPSNEPDRKTNGREATDAEIGPYIIPLIYTEAAVFVAAEFSFQDLSNPSAEYKSVLDFNKHFIETTKTGEFEKVLSLFSSEDGSQDKFASLKSSFGRSRFYQNINSVKHNYGIAWGDYRFMSVEYLSKNGRARTTREDFYCPSESTCKKSMRDFGQPFEIAYVELSSQLENKDQWQDKGQSRDGFFHSVDTKKSFNVLPSGISNDFGQNPFGITIGIKNLKSDICLQCDPASNGIIESERFLLGKVVEFAQNLQKLDMSDYDTLISYIRKFDKNHKETTGFPVAKWVDGKANTVFTDVRGYISRISKWKGGVPLGYVESDEGVYMFLSMYDGDAQTDFDMEVIFLDKRPTGQYIFRPSGNEKSLEQTLIRDSFILNSMKELFLST